MRKIILFFSLFALLTACKEPKKTIFTISDDEVVVKICGTSTKTEMEDIQKRLKAEKDIDFTFEKTTFTSGDLVDQLDFTVKLPGGTQGSVQNDFTMSDDYSGFMRDYRKNAAHPFRCGTF